MISIALAALAASAAAPTCRPPRFPETPAALLEQCSSVRRRAAERLDALLALPPEKRGILNTAVELDRLLVDLEEESAPLTVLRNLSPSLAVRLAAGDCQGGVAGFATETLGREDVYRALQEVEGRGERLAGDDARLLSRLLSEARRNGARLPVDDRARLRLLKRTLGSYEREFQRNHVESENVVELAEAELGGVSSDVLRRFEPAPGGKLKVTLDNDSYDAVASSCANPETRRRLEFAFNNRTYPANLPLVEQIFALRHRVARLLGYPTYAHLMLEDRMAASPENVEAFIERVRKALAPKAARHAAQLLALKREDEPAAASLDAWDTRYYERRLRARGRSPDPAAVSEYLPLERVLDTVLSASGDAFGLVFREVAPAGAWHSEVRLFEASDRGTGALLGRIYLDLFARSGKAKSNADYSLMGRRAGGEPCRLAAAAFVMSLHKPADGPVLLKHADLVSLLHGLGHALHQLLSSPRHAGFSGTRVAQDFTDVPAKVLESWAWDKGVLTRLSGHFKDGRPMPDDMAEAVARSRLAAAALGTMASVVQAGFDLDVHAGEPADVDGRHRSLVAELMPVPQTPGTHPELKYSIVKGGGVGLYVPRWSEAAAADVLERFSAAGLLDPAVGGEFRRLLLEPGGSEDPRKMLEAFLGREPGEAAFLRLLDRI